MATQPSLVGEATTPGQTGVPTLPQHDIEEPYKEKQSGLTVYLNMELMEQRDDTFVSTSRLKAGKSYFMFFNASESYNPACQAKELTISSDIKLILEFEIEGDDPVKILIENPTRNMTYQQIALGNALQEEKNYEPFSLTVPLDSPAGTASFCLNYIILDAKYKLKREAASLQISIDSPYTPYEKALRKCYCDMTKPPPEHTAFLYVMEASSNTLHMTYGYNGKVFNEDATDWQPTVFDPNTKSWQPIRLADFAERAKSSYEQKKAQASIDPTSEVVEEIRKAMRNFSSHGPVKLLKWLCELFKNSEEQLGFIIVDETDFEIPWEMLELADEEYLGTKAAIARWSKVQLYSDIWLLYVHEAHYQGSVLFYLNDRESKTKQPFAEGEILNNVRGTAYPTIHNLVESMSVHNALKHVGLIYLGCHGNNGIELLGSDKVTYIDFHNPIKHDDPRPIAFVNACNSARLKRGDGLRNAFLERYASGYIGTLGEVISTYASKIAGCILTALTEQNGIQVAELLRQLRAETVAMTAKQQSIREANNAPSIIALYEHRDLNQLSESEKNLYFLTIFMYVYYGNPLARLGLVSKAEAKGRGA